MAFLLPAFASRRLASCKHALVMSAPSPSNASVPVDETAFLANVVSAMPAFVIGLDPEQRVTYINYRPTNERAQDIIGKPVHELLSAEDVAQYDAARDLALRTKRGCAYLAKQAPKSVPAGASQYACEVVHVPDRDGRQTMCLVVTAPEMFVDHTPAAQSREAISQDAANVTKVGVWVSNDSEDRVNWNEAMRDIAGCPPMSRHAYVQELVHPDDRPEMLQKMAELDAAGTISLSYRIVRPDGEIRRVIHRGARVESIEGVGAHTVNIIVDLTELECFQGRQRGTQPVEGLSVVTAGVAHNFNNLLAIIRPALELAAQRSSPLHTPYLNDAKHAADRAAELVEQLMVYAGHRQAPPPALLNLRELVLNTAAMCQHSFGSSVQLEVSVRSERTDVLANEVALERVMMNVLINARDACMETDRDQRCIKLTVQDACSIHPHEVPGVPQSFLCVRVEDNGAGMSRETIEHAFEPFFTTKSPGKGTGLGLATSERIIRKHGGFMTIESEPKMWTRVSIYLPSVAASDHAIPASPGRQNSGARRGTVLIVDDEPALRRLVSVLLRAEGYAVSEAAHGEACVAELDNGLRPDLILLDRTMPGWSSRRTLRAIRERSPTARVVLFTARGVPEDERAEVLDVLSKPFETKDLVHCVERCIGTGT